MTTTLTEHTDDTARAQGFRALVLTHEGEDTRSIIAINAHHADNIALAGDEPTYLTLPGVVTDNVTLAALLSQIVSALLTSPHCSNLTPESPHSSALCHEG